ncbi:MAG TPA: uracil-DNA glycosylase family protein [Acidimicrobiia bacterium]
MSWNDWWDGRGHPSEHDPGPPRNRRWARLFASTPNYRGLGLHVAGRELFRWHFGPMFYRGRLGDSQVKVLIVGQEGAQDESLAHRAFTGGTGARLQHFLDHLGITRSYLFLNTFCYPIYGQYGQHLHWLAQNPNSPIAAHRNAIFDYALSRNDVHLIVAVGTAAKQSVSSWLSHRGVTSTWVDLSRADPFPISPRLRTIGVLHPGGAASGARREVEEDFRRAVTQVERWRRDDPDWLPSDPNGSPRPAAAYRYGSKPIPFRDFPFGTTWRLGSGGTSSNRKDAQRSIQLFSAEGHYNGRGDDPAYPSNAALGSKDGYEDAAGDLPYEPPRRLYKEYDPGPDRVMARLLAPDWPAPFDDDGHLSLGFGPIYRGRFEDVTLLVLSEPGCHDDLFTGRALTGDDGQHLQRWMEAVGIDRRYLILRVPPFDTTGASRRALREWVDHPDTLAAYARILARARQRSPRLGPVVTIGEAATRLTGKIGIPATVDLPPYGRAGSRQAWKEAAETMRSVRYRKDRRATYRYDGDRSQIPRIDLPYGTLRWQGTSGDRAIRGRVRGDETGDYFKLYAPGWVAALAPVPLTRAEKRAVADA